MKLVAHAAGSPQVDPTVALKVITPLPGLVTFAEFAASPPVAPPLLIGGILHQGCKMILCGTSKSNKSWCLLDLALSVASGSEWWGRPCTRVPVVYVNFELQQWAMAQRLNAICARRPEIKGVGQNLMLWNLRGHNADLSVLRPELGETAEAISLRQAGENSVLQTLALSLSDSLTRVLRVVLWWVGGSDTIGSASGVTLGLNTDFSAQGITAAEITATVAAWQAGAISQRTMLEAFRRGELLPPYRSNEAEAELVAKGRPATAAVN